MGKKEKILELLKEEVLTTKEISNHLNYQEGEIRVYINRLKKNGLIIEVGRKERYIMYSANKKALERKRKDLIDKLVYLMIKIGINSTDFDIEITEKEIKPSIKRLRRKGKIG